MIRSVKDYESATNLRRGGLSYSQISKQLSIPKNTLRYWFANKKWSNTIKDSLVMRGRLQGENQLILANQARQRKTLTRHASYIKEAVAEFRILKANPIFIAGICLYWGEGAKANRNIVSVINTDSEMLKVVTNFFRKCLQVNDSDLRIELYVYDDINEKEAVLFWSKELNIRREQFIKTQHLKSKSKLTKRRCEHGICRVYFSNTRQSIKIAEWIRLIGLEMRD